MNLTPQEYEKLNKQAQKKSPCLKNCTYAFLIGGLICTIGQALKDLYRYGGMDADQATTVASVTLIAITAILTGLQLFDKIAKVAGAGTIVPITGFANAMVSPALEFKSEGYVLGLGAKMFVIAGPVIVYGITASAIYGLIVFLFGL